MAEAAENLKAAYPEIGAGGFSRTDATVEFYTRINALIDPRMTVLDIGAGRGAQLLNRNAPYRADLQRLQGKVKRLVGIDVDRAVLDNPILDEAHVVAADGRLPFEDAAFDLVYSDWVLEHVAEPAAFAAEALRVLKRGGWFCARTPNRWGMTGLATNLVPNRHHARLVAILQPGREARDVFPTTYAFSTRRRLRRWFRAGDWEDYSYFYNAEPPYVQRSRLLLRAAALYQRLAPAALATNLHIFLRKR